MTSNLISQVPSSLSSFNTQRTAIDMDSLGDMEMFTEVEVDKERQFPHLYQRYFIQLLYIGLNGIYWIFYLEVAITSSIRFFIQSKQKQN